ncbi:hypothetical protein C8J56DRAFT_588063 [Mycena floridula]|nr:hypothetical protein C8J56DRAFT_588063 [Mycena floridula]
MYLSTKFIAVAFLACVSAAPVLEIRTPLFGGKAAAPPNALPAGAPVYHKKLKRFYAPKWIPGGNGVKAQVEDKIAEFWAKDKERQRYHSVI